MASNLSRVLSGMEETVITATNQVITVDPDTRQLNIPGIELVFGVEGDGSSERKYFQFPRYVGDNLDLAGSFLRVNYRNANGDKDSYLVNDVSVEDDYVVFSWLVSEKVVAYKGQVRFVVCAVGPDLKVKWHTTLGTGISSEGLEPDTDIVAGTEDVIAQLIAMVEQQTTAVENVGAEWVRNVQNEGTEQIIAVQTAAEAAEAASVAEIEAKGVNTRNSIPEDYTALSEAVDNLNRTRGAAIVCEVEGSAITVSDASDMKMQGLRIFGRSTQDGTPTPEAPVEIKSVEKPVVTVAGKNLLNVKNGGTKIGVTETVTSGRVTFSGTAEGSGGRTAWKRSDVVTLPPGTYRMSMTVPKGTAPQPCLTINGTTTVLASDANSFTVTEPTSAYLGFNYDAGVSYDAENVAVQLEVGKIATDYEPYSGQTVKLTHTLPGIPVTSGGNYTDSDGQQWICDEVDLEHGVYVQRLFAETITDFTKATSYTYDGLGTSCAVAIDKSVTAHTALCSHFVIAHKSTTVDRFNLIGKTIYFKLAGELSWEEWVARMSELAPVVIGVLDTPIETTLSETEIAAYRALHSNYPNTTVLNDAGAHMVVKYAADTKLYIDNKIAALVSGV